MKKITFEQLPVEIQQVLEDVATKRVLVVRNDVPFAVVAGVGFKDEEDLELEESAEFWQMIEERRHEAGSVSLEEFVAELDAKEQGTKDINVNKPVEQPVAERP
jgi:hypothetical protein